MTRPRIYYNEVDPVAAQWLRHLIMFDYIAPGDVDERSIEDVKPEDLQGYTQCHFFAGIGVWSHALRLAGWPDDRPVWTGSCPCQPFSAAGKRGGTADERHLWPAFFHLIQHAKPRDVPIFGEQVASKPGLAWLDLVHADMEGQGYAVGAIDLCAAGVGAPHIRQRSFFVADTNGGNPGAEGLQRGRQHGQQQEDGCTGVALGDTSGERLAQQRSERGASPETSSRAARKTTERTDAPATRIVEDAECAASERLGQHCGQRIRFEEAAGFTRSGGCRGWWREADWLWCADSKYRPVEPGTFPLAHGAAARVGRLRAYGNAICAPQAAAFIQAFMEGR